MKSSNTQYLTTHLQSALAAANQLQSQHRRLVEERDQAHNRATVVQGTLISLLEALSDDPGLVHLHAQTNAIINDAASIANEEAWEQLLRQMGAMSRALHTIARLPGPGRAQTIAQNALEEIQ